MDGPRMVSNCGPSMDGQWMTTVTVASTDTLTEWVREGVHPWMVHRWSVIVASTDTLTDGVRQGVHPWMVHRWSVIVVHQWMVHG